jgi:hypothetical protein
MYGRLKYLRSIHKMRASRYINLLKIIYQRRCCNIMEIGVYRGKHAKQMIETARIFWPASEVNYYGFDLFEKLTEEDIAKEHSKRPITCADVRQQLKKTKANIHLYIGYTNETLPRFLEEFQAAKITLDFIFIDGGHSLKTIASDWSYVREMMGEQTVVLFDDYYTNNEPEVAGFGCQSLIDALDRGKYSVEILQPADVFEKEWGMQKTSIVKVQVR